jgi:hypothetical protein
LICKIKISCLNIKIKKKIKWDYYFWLFVKATINCDDTGINRCYIRTPLCGQLCKDCDGFIVANHGLVNIIMEVVENN